MTDIAHPYPWMNSNVNITQHISRPVLKSGKSARMVRALFHHKKAINHFFLFSGVSEGRPSDYSFMHKTAHQPIFTVLQSFFYEQWIRFFQISASRSLPAAHIESLDTWNKTRQTEGWYFYFQEAAERQLVFWYNENNSIITSIFYIPFEKFMTFWKYSDKLP